LIQLASGDVTDFADDFLGGHPHPLRYWFCFAKEGFSLADLRRTVESATTEENLKVRLAKVCAVIGYGFEDVSYTFITGDPSVAKLLADSIEASK